ncbi:hypothetical protein [Tsukamurella serpentis]
MTVSITYSSRRVLATAALGLSLAVAGCATVPGAGTADPQVVAGYQSAIASSRAAAAEAAGKSACASWRAGYETRTTATRATVAHTKDPKWNWNTIAPVISAEFAAITTESNQLTSTISTAQPAATIHTALVDYKSKLDAYNEALHADQSARGSNEATWPRTKAANEPLRSATSTLQRLCPL